MDMVPHHKTKLDTAHRQDNTQKPVVVDMVADPQL
jgi:hypothetical protein